MAGAGVRVSTGGGACSGTAVQPASATVYSAAQ